MVFWIFHWVETALRWFEKDGECVSRSEMAQKSVSCERTLFMQYQETVWDHALIERTWSIAAREATRY